MKVLKARVNWMYDWGNDPHLEILVDRIPEWDEMVWNEISPGMFYSEKDGFSNKFAYSKPDRGFGGRKFTITMADGSKKDLIGPWSSRAGCCTKYGYPNVDVSITEDPKVFEKGYTFYGGMITLEKAKEACELIKGVKMIEIDFHGEPLFLPHLVENQCVGHYIPGKGGNRRCLWCGHKDYPEFKLV